MAVGAGSIKRASKASNGTVEAAQEQAVKKPAAKKTATKKDVVAKKEQPAKKSEAQDLQNPVNAVCRLTEEMPIHLL